MILVASQSNPIDPVTSAFGRFVFGDALDVQTIGHVFANSTVRQKTEFLENHRRLFPTQFAQLGFGHRQDVFTINQDFPASGFDQSVDVPDQGGLPRSRKPHHHLNLLFRDFERHVVDPENVVMLVQKVRFGQSFLDQRQHFFGRFAEDFVEIFNADFGLSHCRAPVDMPVDVCRSSA